ncbi:hypothetical protein MTP03_02710 [Tsukamurella sp. PLM1]|nr:hypothetical protein MTP03_02710 [Tsukamurella sp. PLM1]
MNSAAPGAAFGGSFALADSADSDDAEPDSAAGGPAGGEQGPSTGRSATRPIGQGDVHPSGGSPPAAVALVSMP